MLTNYRSPDWQIDVDLLTEDGIYSKREMDVGVGIIGLDVEVGVWSGERGLDFSFLCLGGGRKG